MGNKRHPSVVVAIRAILRVMRDLNGSIFPLLRDVTRFPQIEVGCRCSEKYRDGQVSATRPAGSLVPLLSSLAYPVLPPSRHAWSVHLQAMVLMAVVWNRPLMVGSSLGDFVFKRVPNYRAHRSRTRTLSFSSVPSSMMNCSLLAFRSSDITVLFRCL